VSGGRLAVLCSGLALLLAGCGSGQTVIARKSARGQHAGAEAAASVDVAKGLSLQVSARPKQRVTGSWTIVCRAGDTPGARNGGDFVGKAPLEVAMRDVDFTLTTSCTVLADARLARSGRLDVKILKQ
jgi:hypothetical protein